MPQLMQFEMFKLCYRIKFDIWKYKNIKFKSYPLHYLIAVVVTPLNDMFHTTATNTLLFLYSSAL
jgi:hypothetical protein